MSETQKVDVPFFYIHKHTAGAIANPMTPYRDIRAHRVGFELPEPKADYLPVYLKPAESDSDDRLVLTAKRLVEELDVLIVKHSAKNPNAAFIDWRDWCALRSHVSVLRNALAATAKAQGHAHE